MSDKIFYKYKKIYEHTYDLLLKNEFYYSFPHEMNDPFDCYIYSEYKGEKKDYINFLKWYPGSEEEKVRAYKFFESCNFDPEEIYRKIILPVRNNESKIALINCFSAVNDSIIMWSHYAEFHKGICLGFNAVYEGNLLYFEVEDIVTKSEQDLNKYAPLYKVNYSDSFPEPFNGLKDDDKEIFKFLITKFGDWNYEKEYRSILWYDNVNKKIIKFRKDILKEVIFGMRTPEAEKNKITDLVNEIYIKKGFDVKLKTARQAQKDYKILI